jgi:hypothetical protein
MFLAALTVIVCRARVLRERVGRAPTALHDQR